MPRSGCKSLRRFTPALSLKGEGAVCAGIILWGTLSPIGERGLLGAVFYPLPGGERAG